MFQQLFNKKTIDIRQKKLIVVIGFNKTGTTSIHRLFQSSGFKSVHWDEGKLTKKMFENAMQAKPILQGYDDKFDVFSDLVFRTDSYWCEGNALYRQIEQQYPNALFIYNYREMDAWLESRCKHAEQLEEQTILELHKKILDTSDIEVIKKHWKTTRLNYEEELKEYFGSKSNLLEIDIKDVKFVEKLSIFIQANLNPEHWGLFNKT
ncbi:hypothetical protein L0668_06515 [Paraglaciecola aquimarina]|uniref:Sulfotransferase family protein n=1 Tax=Paraglaciecola algarum TaxID=3050085 RepID=A0ABS9D4D7_9ALTE|nr:sulfotransferase [Paraglaciecola sp. G1-23]MCF2947751.1 hypothetical protein [Paraglaciecola sp. G1-23]